MDIKETNKAPWVDSTKEPKRFEGQLAVFVGDDEEIATECLRILEGFGFTASRCLKEEDALSLLEGRDVKLLVVSVREPDEKALELLKVAKEQDPLLTALLIVKEATHDFVLKILRVGCDGLVYGEFSPEEFYATLSEALEKSALRRDLSRLRLLYRLSQLMTSTFDLEKFLPVVLDIAVSELRASSGSIMLHDEATNELVIAAIHGLRKELLGRRQSVNEGIAGLVARRLKPVIISPRVNMEPQVLSMLKRKEIISSISFPMVCEGRFVGVLNVNSVEGNVIFGEEDLELLSVLCTQAAAVIANIELHEKVHRSHLGAIMALARAIEARDPYTKGHSEKVSEYIVKFCEVLKVSVEDREALRVAGLLHDVGKIGIPDSVLLKPGKLTKEEYELIKRHPVISSSIIEQVPFPWDIRTAVYHHHERWDGKGYPSGLKGEEIPFSSRVIAVADTFDALTSDRAYRRAMSDDQALEVIKEVAGSQLDPELSKAFVSMMRSKKIASS
jgi:putative nucleotidyltransferase with HDIG domain